jgi:hypothetical protein
MAAVTETPDIADVEIIVALVEDGTDADAVRVFAEAQVTLDEGVVSRLDGQHDGLLPLDSPTLDEDIEAAARDAVQQLQGRLAKAGVTVELDARELPRNFRF